MSRRARQQANARPWEINTDPNWTLLATLDSVSLKHRQAAELVQHQAAPSRCSISSEMCGVELWRAAA